MDLHKLCSKYNLKTNDKTLKGVNNIVKGGKIMLISFTEITSELGSFLIKLAIATVPLCEKQNSMVNKRQKENPLEYC